MLEKCLAQRQYVKYNGDEQAVQQLSKSIGQASTGKNMEAIAFGFLSYFGFLGAEKAHELVIGREPEAEVCEADEEYIKRRNNILSVTHIGEGNE